MSGSASAVASSEAIGLPVLGGATVRGWLNQFERAALALAGTPSYGTPVASPKGDVGHLGLERCAAASPGLCALEMGLPSFRPPTA